MPETPKINLEVVHKTPAEERLCPMFREPCLTHKCVWYRGGKNNSPYICGFQDGVNWLSDIHRDLRELIELAGK